MANKEWVKRGADGLSFGERLGDLIESKGITQSQLAEKTGINQSAISEYINGKKGGVEERAPDCATIIALSKYFSVSTDYLLGQSKIRTPNSDMIAACEFTGLSEQAITSLRAYSKQSVSFISEFLEKAEITRIGLMYENLNRSMAKLHICERTCGRINENSKIEYVFEMKEQLRKAKERSEFDRWKLERSIIAILDRMMEGNINGID